MARLAVSVAGAAIGGYFGGPAGAQAGFMLGSIVGAYAFPDKGANVTVHGPRLGDKTVTSSAYGAPIAIPYGTVRTSGNLIWSSGIREQRNTDTQSTGGGKGGGGGGSQTSVTYTYFASFAVALGEGIAEDVLRIWADSKLIYDKTGTGVVANDAVIFKVYPGSETQLPDALIEDAEGVDSTPAFRGLAYVVFDDLPLANYGNRIPNLTFEVTYNKSDSRDVLSATMLNYPVTGYAVNHLAIDTDREYFYLLKPTTGTKGLRKFDARTLVEQRSILEADCLESGYFSLGLLATDQQGHVHACIGASNNQPIVKINATSLKEVARFGTSSASTISGPWGFQASKFMVALSIVGLTGVERFYIYGGFQRALGVLDQSFNFVAGGAEIETDYTISGLCVGDGVVYITANSGSLVQLYKLTLLPGAWAAQIGGGWVQYGTTLEHLLDITLADFGLAATAITNEPPIYEASDNSVIIGIRAGAVGEFLAKYTEAGLVWYAKPPAIWGYSAANPATAIRRGTFAYYVGSTAYIFDTRDGSYRTQTGWTGITPYGAQFFNDRESAIIGLSNVSPYVFKLFLDRGTGQGVTVASVVTDIAQRVGLTPSDIDVTELDNTVLGYIVSRQTTASSVIRQLAEAFRFDVVESDYVLTFPLRGRATSFTIPENDLAFVRDAEKITEARVQEVELPSKVSIVYMEPTHDYQTGTQFAKRTVLPLPAMYSNNTMTFEYPIVFTADHALQLATILLYESWVQRSGYSAKLPWKYLQLDPSDVFTTTVGSVLYTARCVSTVVGADLVIDISSLAEETAVYTSELEAAVGGGFPPQFIINPVPSILWFLDVPLLRDQDDSGGAYSVGYAAIGSPRTEDWTGAVLYKSSDGNSWAEIERATDPIQYGTIDGVLDPVEAPWTTDYTSSLRVYIESGTLSSCTYTEMMNGANSCVIGGEVCGFMNATLDADGYYTLTTFLRAQRGTDYSCYDHVNGETLIVLAPANILAITSSIDLLAAAFFYRAVTYGTLMEAATIESHAADGKDLMPYSPVHVDAVDTAGDLVITWERRTRIAGDMKDGTDTVPLAEDFEKYEVDVYIGITVVRTLLATDVTTVTYTSADQTTDGYDILTGVLKLEVFQMSAVVGRGFGRLVTLEV